MEKQDSFGGKTVEHDPGGATADADVLREGR
jgi:hypothetical protein